MSEFGHSIGVPGPGEPQPLDEPTYLPPGTPVYSDRQYRPEPDAPPDPGADDLELSTAHARARQMAEAGDLTGARTLIEEALAAGEPRLGRDDPSLVPLMVDLATLARRLGNLTEARNQLRRAYTIIVTAAGPEHPTSLAIEGRLAAVVYRLGEPTESHDWHLADAGQRVLGAEHPAVRGAQQRLANAAPTPVQTTPTAPPLLPFAPPAAHGAPATAAGPMTPSTPMAAPEPLPLPAVVSRATYPPTTTSARYGPALTGEVYAASDATVRLPRRNVGGVALVASLLVLFLVGAVVVARQLLWPGGGTSAPNPVGQGAITVTANPTPTAPPASPAPTSVTIVDGGGTVTLTWTDPSDGRVPFVVSGARQGNALAALASVPAGQTTITIYGLNENYDYCFTVAAVWSSTMVQESIRTCTSRALASTSA
jgi:hypothetical protein